MQWSVSTAPLARSSPGLLSAAFIGPDRYPQPENIWSELSLPRDSREAFAHTPREARVHSIVQLATRIAPCGQLGDGVPLYWGAAPPLGSSGFFDVQAPSARSAPPYRANRWNRSYEEVDEASHAAPTQLPMPPQNILAQAFHDNEEVKSEGAVFPLSGGSSSSTPAQGGALPERPSLPLQVKAQGWLTSELCHFCFRVLRSHLQNQTPPCFPASADPSFKAPLFVTWMKRKTEDGKESGSLELRGCIGCLEPIVFHSGLSDYALRSSLHDRRFPAVRLEEVPSLTCKLSILCRFEKCAHIYDWQIGLHGVLIKFDANDRHYIATYLPEVPVEQNLTQQAAIRELVAKTGYLGACDEELLARIDVTRYQTIVESVSYWEHLCSCTPDVSCYSSQSS